MTATMALSFRDGMLPWASGTADDRRLRRIQQWVIGAALLLCALVPWLPVHVPPPPPPVEPVRVAKLMLPPPDIKPVKPLPPPAPTAEAPKPAPKPKTPKARPPPPQPKPQPSNLHLSLAGGALLATGTAPAQAIGFFGYAGARWPSVSFGIEGRADLPAEKSEPQGSASASLMLASLLPCVHVGVGFACAVGSLGALQGSGEDVSRPAKATTVFAAAGVRGGTDVPITESLGVVGFVDLRTNLTRTTLRLNDREVWSTPAFGGDLGVGLRGQL